MKFMTLKYLVILLIVNQKQKMKEHNVVLLLKLDLIYFSFTKYIKKQRTKLYNRIKMKRKKLMM